MYCEFFLMERSGIRVWIQSEMNKECVRRSLKQVIMSICGLTTDILEQLINNLIHTRLNTFKKNK